jgi:hypothetical protein
MSELGALHEPPPLSKDTVAGILRRATRKVHA